MTILIKNACKDFEIIEQGTTFTISGNFVDGSGNAIVLGNLASLALTLYDKVKNQIINSRNAQNVENTNGGTISSNGAFAIVLGPLDNPIVTSGQNPGDRERHIARLTWGWTDGTNSFTNTEEFEFEVEVLASPS